MLALCDYVENLLNADISRRLLYTRGGACGILWNYMFEGYSFQQDYVILCYLIDSDTISVISPRWYLAIVLF